MKTVKARSNSKAAKMGRKVKETMKALSPAGAAGALGDYLLRDRTKKPKARRKTVPANNRSTYGN